jgi:DNA-binding response OmpR family regulator
MRRPLVLVVDDGKQHVTLLRLALMQRGYSVAVVHAPERARSLAEGRPFDAVLVTLDLPAAARTLAALGDARPSVAVLLADEVPEELAAAAGFDAAFRRPVDFDDLDALLQRRVQRRTSGTLARVHVPKRDLGT